LTKTTAIFYALLSGFLLSLGWPEIGNFPYAIFVAFVPLLWVEDKFLEQNQKHTFGYFYLAFFTWNLLTTWWIYYASFFGAVMAIVLNALFQTIVFQAFHYARKQMGAKKGYFAFFALWIAFEYLHLNWELSWPWLTLGNAFANHPSWIQWYEYTGVLGGSFWILLLNYFSFKLLKNAVKKQRFYVFANIFLLLIFTSLPLYFSGRIKKQWEDNGKEKEIVVVQPNIDPYNEKFNPETIDLQLQKMLQLAEQKTTSQTAFIIFPETALPFTIWENEIEENPQYKAIMKLKNKFPHACILIGISSAKYYENPQEKSPTARYIPRADLWYDSYNTALFIDENNRLTFYHKSKLVLGVEKIPYPAVFKYFEKFAINLGGTTGSLGQQKERTVFQSRNGRIAPAICYESVYGEFMTKYIQNGAEAIAVITNDGWWEDTPGYKQHLAYARLRSIETRKSIARSANTGISAFIDSHGNIIQKSEWWKEDALRDSLKFNNHQTFYVKYGDYIGRLMSFLAVLILLFSIVRALTKEKHSWKYKEA
jgi:apolipoprotein N-acyltransferase